MSRPVLLDLFCGAGGAAMGYWRAGFDIIGVDKIHQPRYPFEFIQADAIEFCRVHGKEFDAIHASPPCQRYTRASFRDEFRRKHPDLIPATRSSLVGTRRPWIIENVPGSPLRQPIVLCGLMFGLKVFRHRLFEASFSIAAPSHPTHKGYRIGVDGMCCVIGHGGGPNYRTRLRGAKDDKIAWQLAMGMSWTTRDEMAQAIPPAYTQWIGKQLLEFVLAGRREAG